MSFCPLEKDGTPQQMRESVMRQVGGSYIPYGALDANTVSVMERRMSQAQANGVPSADNDHMWNERLQGGTDFGQITQGELLDKLVNAKFGSAGKRVYPEQLTPADIDQVAPAFRSIMFSDANLPEAGKIGSAMDKGARLGSEVLLLDSLNFTRQIVGNSAAGGFTQQILNGHLEAAISSTVNPAHAAVDVAIDKTLRTLRMRQGRTQLDFTYGPGKLGVETGAIDPAVAGRVGQWEPDPQEGAGFIAHSKTTQWGRFYGGGRTVFEKALRAMSDELPQHPAVKKTLDAMEGTLMAVGGPAVAAAIRKGGSAYEHIQHTSAFWTHYNKLWREGLEEQQLLQRENFLLRINQELGVDVRRNDYLHTVLSDTYRFLGPRYRPVDLHHTLNTVFNRDVMLRTISQKERDAFMESAKGLLGEHVNWQGSIIDQAHETRVKDLFDWTERNVDVWAGRFIPFGRFYIRYLPFAARVAMRHPALTVSYIELNQAMAQNAEAEGWPDWMRNYLRLSSGPFGSSLLINPLNAMGLLGIAWAMDKTPEDRKRNDFQQFMNQVVFQNGLTPAPHWWITFPMLGSGLMGEQAKVINPISQMFGLRVLTNGINLANAYVFKADPINPIGQDTMNYLAEKMSEYNPLGVDLELSYSAKSMDSKIERMMQQMYREDMGWSYEYMVGLQMEYQRSLDPTAVGVNWSAVDDYNNMAETLISEYHSESGKYYEAAFERVADQEASRGPELASIFLIMEEGWQGLQQAGVNVTMGSPIASAQTTEEASTVGGTYVPPWSVVKQNTKFIERLEATGIDPKTFWNQAYYGRTVIEQDVRLNELSPEALDLVQQHAAYTSIGGAEGQEIFDTYYAITFGNVEEDVVIDDATFTPEMINGSTEYAREVIANKYIESVENGQATVDAIQAAQTEIAEGSPEYKLYLAWKEDVGHWRDYGGLETYRRLVCGDAGNEGQCKYYEDMKEIISSDVMGDDSISSDMKAEEINNRLNNSTTSIKAFMVAYGIPFDNENKYSTEDIGKQPSLPLTAQAEYVKGTEGTPGAITADRVNAAIADMEMYERMANDYLMTRYGYGLGGILPLYAAKVMQELVLAGISPPPDGYLAEDYKSYTALAESVDIPATVEGYVAFVTQSNLKPGEWNMKRDFQEMPGGWGFWTGPRGDEPIYVTPQTTGGGGLSYADPTAMGQQFGMMDQQQATGLYGVGIEDPFSSGLNRVSPTGTGQIPSQGINRSTSMGQRLGSLARLIGNG